jgi:raffinose/stachyose/melibiose transport system permease protein
MLYAFFRSLPYELEEAAVMDGCSIYRSFVSIMIPMVKPAVAMQIVLVFMNAWNEFFMAYMLTNKEAVTPLPIGLLNFFVGFGLNQWGLIGAAMVIASIPTVAVYLLFSDQVENALTAGAILK